MAITRKFLREMGLAEEQAEAIIQAHAETVNGLKAETEKLRAGSGTLEELQERLAGLQARYEADTGALRQQLAERDYGEALARAVAGARLRFSSKSAERAFLAAARERKLPLADGRPEGFEDFVKEQREADPAAFLPDQPLPRFAERVGTGHPPAAGKSRAAEIAETYHRSLYGSEKEE